PSTKRTSSACLRYWMATHKLTRRAKTCWQRLDVSPKSAFCRTHSTGRSCSTTARGKSPSGDLCQSTGPTRENTRWRICLKCVCLTPITGFKRNWAH
ncbi:hypothetical protein IWW35_004723, partial [Coemansia sp. RSA 1878]